MRGKPASHDFRYSGLHGFPGNSGIHTLIILGITVPFEATHIVNELWGPKKPWLSNMGTKLLIRALYRDPMQDSDERATSLYVRSFGLAHIALTKPQWFQDHISNPRV